MVPKTNRTQKIYEYVKTHTQILIQSNTLDNTGIDALGCSIDLNLDRANVSKELNMLWKAGKLIKIQGRPVFYLDYITLSNEYPNCFIPSVISKNECLSNYLKEKSVEILENTENIINDPFEDLIGSNGSLLNEIINAKAAVAYPPYGLHTLIIGNEGVGKTELANCMSKYAILNGYKKKGSPFVTLCCRNYSLNPNLFAYTLLGEKKNTHIKKTKGILDESKGGILLLEQIECLPESSINLLCSIISQGYYTHLGDSTNHPVECMIIATTKNMNNSFIQFIQEYTPIVLTLRDIEERGMFEKLEILLHLFSEEAKKINYSIHVHKDIITCFAITEYKNNITQLSNEIKIACSHAFLNMINDPYNKTIYINFHHLSQELLAFHKNNSPLKPKILSLLSSIPSDYLLFNKNGSSNASSLFKIDSQYFSNIRNEQFVNEFNVDINSINNLEDYVNENLNCLKNCAQTQLHVLKNNINPIVYQLIISFLSKNKKYSILLDHEQLLYGILLHLSNLLKRLTNQSSLETKNYPSITEKIYPDEFNISKAIFNYFNKMYNLPVLNKEIDYLASYLAISNQYINKTKVSILVVCHGYSIATQFVNFVKSSIKENIKIDSIDFRNNLQLNDVIELSCLKATKLNQGAGVLIVCDMEPLTSIGETITINTGIPTRTIKSINLPLLLQIAQMSLAGINLLNYHFLETKKNVENILSPSKENIFITNIIDKIISKTSTFIDVHRAVDTLMICLKDILSNLSISYNDEITAKFLIHSVNMLERVISNQSWSYTHLNTFIQENYQKMHIIEKSLQYAENTFGITIPSPEIAYITEIFLSN